MRLINSQTAPFPTELEDLVKALQYREGWQFYLHNEDRDYVDGELVGHGLTLSILIQCVDSYDGSPKRVWHYFPVPPATYDMRSWRRWLFDCIIKVETHEAMEFFTIAGDKPYAPSHGPGNDPYMIREVGTITDQKTSFTGEVNP